MAVYRCKAPFAVHIGGRHRVISGGTLLDDRDPVFKGREHLFEPVETFVENASANRVDRVAVVEQATAEPGELREVAKPKRGPGRPRKAKAEPPAEQDEATAEES